MGNERKRWEYVKNFGYSNKPKNEGKMINSIGYFIFIHIHIFNQKKKKNNLKTE